MWSIGSEKVEQNRNLEPKNKQSFMKCIMNHLNNRIAALTVGGAVVLAGSVLALAQKSKAEASAPPPDVTVDERSVTRDASGRTSFAPVVKKVSLGW